MVLHVRFSSGSKAFNARADSDKQCAVRSDLL